MNLKPIQHYNDEYDRLTVEMCRQLEQRHQAVITGAKTKEEEIWYTLLFKLMMFYDVEMFAGERWENKKKAVEEIMMQDRAKDTLLATAEAPEAIHCLICRTPMKVIGKEFDETSIDGKDRVLFFYECQNHCKHRRAFFHTGEEYRPEAHSCSKCDGKMTGSTVRENSEIVMTDTCIRCGYVETTRFSLAKKARVPAPDFMKDYQRFCYTEEQGQKYLKRKTEQTVSLIQSREREREIEKKQLADRLAKIKKLTITEVEQLLSVGLEKAQYRKLHLSAPEIRKIFIVPFTIQSFKEGRLEHKAIFELQKLMRTLLASTNWRLMSDGIYSQLGVLSGRLRGYDKEYELIELIEKKAKVDLKPDESSE